MKGGLLLVYNPDTDNDFTLILGEPKCPLPGSVNSKSLPMSSMFFNKSKKLPAIVIWFIGLEIFPFMISYPSADKENSPDTGFSPECKPAKLVIYIPFSIPSIISVKDLLPFSTKKLLGDIVIDDLYDDLNAFPVDSIPAFFAVFQECKSVFSSPLSITFLNSVLVPSSSKVLDAKPTL